jgi:hypothetical protein
MKMPKLLPTTLVLIAIALSLGWNVTQLVTQTVIHRGDGATQTTTQTSTSQGFWFGLRTRG